MKGREMSERIWIDCEFDGFGGDLISMALVAEYGGHWYGIMPSKSGYTSWVFENVIPVLKREEATIEARSREEFLLSFRNYMDQFDNPIIISDWYTDLKHFLDCFQGNDHSESFNFSCSMVLDMSLSSDASAVPHNAFYDALAIAKSNT